MPAIWESSSAADHEAVTKSDSTVYDPPFRALFIGTGGDVAIKSKKGTSVTYKNLPDGSTLMVSGIQVLSTGTDASDIVALY